MHEFSTLKGFNPCIKGQTLYIESLVCLLLNSLPFPSLRTNNKHDEVKKDSA